MNEGLAALAAQYNDFRERINPTTGHMQGHYTYADRFEDFSREGEAAVARESRDYTARAEAIDPEPLSPDERITRNMIAWEGRIRAELIDTRTDDFSVD